MQKDRYAAIHEYLQAKFPACIIEAKNDFNRRAYSFKIHVAAGPLLLRVAQEFIEDNDAPEIRRHFDLWNLAGILSNEKALGVLVTTDGPSTFART